MCVCRICTVTSKSRAAWMKPGSPPSPTNGDRNVCCSRNVYNSSVRDCPQLIQYRSGFTNERVLHVCSLFAAYGAHLLHIPRKLFYPSTEYGTHFLIYLRIWTHSLARISNSINDGINRMVEQDAWHWYWDWSYWLLYLMSISASVMC